MLSAAHPLVLPVPPQLVLLQLVVLGVLLLGALLNLLLLLWRWVFVARNGRQTHVLHEPRYDVCCRGGGGGGVCVGGWVGVDDDCADGVADGQVFGLGFGFGFSFGSGFSSGFGWVRGQAERTVGVVTFAGGRRTD